MKHRTFKIKHRSSVLVHYVTLKACQELILAGGQAFISPEYYDERLKTWYTRVEWFHDDVSTLDRLALKASKFIKQNKEFHHVNDRVFSRYQQSQPIRNNKIKPDFSDVQSGKNESSLAGQLGKSPVCSDARVQTSFLDRKRYGDH